MPYFTRRNPVDEANKNGLNQAVQSSLSWAALDKDWHHNSIMIIIIIMINKSDSQVWKEGGR